MLMLVMVCLVIWIEEGCNWHFVWHWIWVVENKNLGEKNRQGYAYILWKKLDILMGEKVEKIAQKWNQISKWIDQWINK